MKKHLCMCFLMMFVLLLCSCAEHPIATVPTTTVPEATVEPTTAPTTEPTEPPVEKIATATISSTGDLLFHTRVIESGYNDETGEYNYDSIYAYVTSYIQQADYAVANLEGTLCGLDNGFKHSGYPGFNTPDASVDAAKQPALTCCCTLPSFPDSRSRWVMGVGLPWNSLRMRRYSAMNFLDLQMVK